MFFQFSVISAFFAARSSSDRLAHHCIFLRLMAFLSSPDMFSIFCSHSMCFSFCSSSLMAFFSSILSRNSCLSSSVLASRPALSSALLASQAALPPLPPFLNQLFMKPMPFLENQDFTSFLVVLLLRVVVRLF